MVVSPWSPPCRCTVKRSVSSLFKIDRFQATYGNPWADCYCCIQMRLISVVPISSCGLVIIVINVWQRQFVAACQFAQPQVIVMDWIWRVSYLGTRLNEWRFCRVTVYLVGLVHRYFKLVVKLQKDLNNNSPIMGRATDSTQNQRQLLNRFQCNGVRQSLFNLFKTMKKYM